MTRDCRGLPRDMRVCQECTRLAEPTVDDKSERDRVNWITPDFERMDGRLVCHSRKALAGLTQSRFVA